MLDNFKRLKVSTVERFAAFFVDRFFLPIFINV